MPTNVAFKDFSWSCIGLDAMFIGKGPNKGHDEYGHEEGPVSRAFRVHNST